MKYLFRCWGLEFLSSPPSRGAWIEIETALMNRGRKEKSPPSRGAWIEISREYEDNSGNKVAPLTGGVD